MRRESCPHCGHTKLVPTHVAGPKGFSFFEAATHRHCPHCQATVTTANARRQAELQRCAAKRVQALRRERKQVSA